MDFTLLSKNLEKKGYRVSVFATKQEAADYLNDEIDGETVGFGGSMTLHALELYDRLLTHNAVLWHSKRSDPFLKEHDLKKAMRADVYLSSVNGIAETGEIINIDGTCNRVAATLYGHEKVYFVVGKNKLAEDYDKALWRARNIAAPKNAFRLKTKTPCAEMGDQCYDCKSPARICRALSVLWCAPTGSQYEVVLVKEDLGY